MRSWPVVALMVVLLLAVLSLGAAQIPAIRSSVPHTSIDDGRVMHTTANISMSSMSRTVSFVTYWSLTP